MVERKFPPPPPHPPNLHIVARAERRMGGKAIILIQLAIMSEVLSSGIQPRAENGTMKTLSSKLKKGSRSVPNLFKQSNSLSETPSKEEMIQESKIDQHKDEVSSSAFQEEESPCLDHSSEETLNHARLPNKWRTKNGKGELLSAVNIPKDDKELFSPAVEYGRTGNNVRNRGRSSLNLARVSEIDDSVGREEDTEFSSYEPSEKKNRHSKYECFKHGCSKYCCLKYKCCETVTKATLLLCSLIALYMWMNC